MSIYSKGDLDINVSSQSNTMHLLFVITNTITSVCVYLAMHLRPTVACDVDCSLPPHIRLIA